MPNAINLTGVVFGKLTVIGEAPSIIGNNGKPRRRSLCRCACGKETIIQNGHLRSGNNTSCGCQRAETLRAKLTKHGHASRNRASDSIYDYWKNLKKSDAVCELWRSSFEAFIADVGERPPDMVLEMIDLASIFKLGNVRWVPRSEQRVARAKDITINGVTGSLKELWQKFGKTSYGTVFKRIKEGMSKEEAILAPLKPHSGGTFKHGAARRGTTFPRTYRIWRIMLRRCSDTRMAKYAIYGARGITVCERWKDYNNFLADMGECPSDKHSIHRLDNDKGYETSNCKWADALEQANNKQNTVRFTVRGFTGTVAELCRHFGCNYSRATERVRSGKQIEAALFEPSRKSGA